MSLRTITLALVMLCLSVSLQAQQDPLLGTWKINVAKSKFSPTSTPSRSDVMKYEPFGAAGIKLTRTTISGKGETEHENFSANYDGKDYTITGTPSVDTVVLKRIDAYTTERINKKAGKVTTTIRSVVSRDGKTLTTTTTGTNASGTTVNNVRVWEKQ